MNNLLVSLLARLRKDEAGQGLVESVLRTSNPPRRTKARASGGVSVIAFRSNGIRDITYRVPGFHGLFSHKAKIPPACSDRQTYSSAPARSPGGM